MKRTTILLLLAPLAAALAGLAVAAPGGSSALSAAKNATAAFHDLDAAEDAGYAEFKDAAGIACIESGAGGMGVHYVNLPLVLDGEIDPLAPESLVYEIRADGKRHLVALEYIVFEADWQGVEPPALFGRTFDHTPAGNRYGIPAFYALHAWIWKPNPAGDLEPYNPRVSC